MKPNTWFHSFTGAKENLAFTDGNLFIFQRWNWEYSSCLEFQKFCLEHVRQNPQQRILIVCNHAPLFTMGRGLQRNDAAKKYQLVDFVPQSSQLPFPLFHITRGGGLTFHHPGQWILYPIVKLTPKLSAKDIIQNMLNTVKGVFEEEFEVSDLNANHDLLGLWRGTNKMASVGIAIERYTTFHGMAVNIETYAPMQDALKQLNPCGISGETYLHLDELISHSNLIEVFHQKIMPKLPQILEPIKGVV